MKDSNSDPWDDEEQRYEADIRRLEEELAEAQQWAEKRLASAREAIREMFREKYGNHAPEKWEWAARGREKALARLLPEHPTACGLEENQE